MFVAPITIIRKRRIIRKLLNAGAVSAETAKTLYETGIFKGAGFLFFRLEIRGVLVKVENERYYVNLNKCGRF